VFLFLIELLRPLIKLFFDNIWRKRVHYIKRVQDYENGGLQAFDFYCINGMLIIEGKMA